MSAIYTLLLQHPDLGPKVVQALDLETVLTTFRLTSQKVQELAEATIVEAHIQETIQSRTPAHRLDPGQVHYWSYSNVPDSKWTLGTVFQKLLDAEKKKGANNEWPSSRDPDSIVTRVRQYLLEYVFTPELARIGSPSSYVSGFRNWDWLTPCANPFALPESIQRLPVFGRETLGVAHRQGLLGGLEEWHINGKWDGGEVTDNSTIFAVLADSKVNYKLRVLSLECFQWEEVLAVVGSCGNALESLCLSRINWYTQEEEEANNKRQQYGGASSSDSEEVDADGGQGKGETRGDGGLRALPRDPYDLYWLKLVALLASNHPNLKVLDAGNLEDRGGLLPKPDVDQLHEWFSQLGKLQHLSSFEMKTMEQYGSGEPTISCERMAALIVEHLPNIEKIPRFEFSEFSQLEAALDLMIPKLKKLESIRPAEGAAYMDFESEYEKQQSALAAKCVSQYPHVEFKWGTAMLETIRAMGERARKKKESLRLNVENDLQLTQILPLLPNIKDLSLDFGPRQSWDGMRDSNNPSEEAKAEKEAKRRQITDEIGSILSAHCPDLEYLSVEGSNAEGCPALSDRFLLNLRGCRALRSLSIGNIGTESGGVSVQMILWCTRTLWPSMQRVSVNSGYPCWLPYRSPLCNKNVEDPSAPGDVDDSLAPPHDMSLCVPTWDLCPNLQHFSLGLPADARSVDTLRLGLIPWFDEYHALVKNHAPTILEDVNVRFPELTGLGKCRAEETKKQNAAAIVFQSVQRGRKGRARARELKAEKEGAEDKK